MSEDLCVSRVPLFQGLGHDDQLRVASIATPTSLDAGGQLYPAGDDAAPLVVVHTGALKVVHTDAQGREQILRVLGPGEFLGESAFLTGRRPDYAAVALQPARLCVFPHAHLGRLIATHPSVAVRMLQAVSTRLADAESRLASVISGDVTSRLAEYLLSLRGEPTPAGLEITLPMSKKDVAAYLDTTPESVSRQLRRLQESGIARTVGARGIVIRDVDALMELTAAT